MSHRGFAFSVWRSAVPVVVARLAVGVRLCRTALVGPPCGAVAELARTDSPRLSDCAALEQRLPCLPAWWPACGPTESPEPHPPGASSGFGIARGHGWRETGDGAPVSGVAPMRIVPVTTTGHDIRCRSKKPIHFSPPSRRGRRGKDSSDFGDAEPAALGGDHARHCLSGACTASLAGALPNVGKARGARRAGSGSRYPFAPAAPFRTQSSTSQHPLEGCGVDLSR